ncbi:MAG: hypothetical protein EOP32_15560 [Rhodococcus sp. (in: high G+C Gram-positive bacteria)]|nr:MAG: hypothetical protein EOP32_15560 [Rhodococcus sp. (in: high G+C Gram-positive bacteria)]
MGDAASIRLDRQDSRPTTSGRAACQGVTIGGGLGLALVCDFRFASPESRFGAPFATLGMHPGSGI